MRIETIIASVFAMAGFIVWDATMNHSAWVRAAALFVGDTIRQAGFA